MNPWNKWTDKLNFTNLISFTFVYECFPSPISNFKKPAMWHAAPVEKDRARPLCWKNAVMACPMLIDHACKMMLLWCYYDASIMMLVNLTWCPHPLCFECPTVVSSTRFDKIWILLFSGKGGTFTADSMWNPHVRAGIGGIATGSRSLKSERRSTTSINAIA